MIGEAPALTTWILTTQTPPKSALRRCQVRTRGLQRRPLIEHQLELGNQCYPHPKIDPSSPKSRAHPPNPATSRLLQLSLPHLLQRRKVEREVSLKGKVLCHP